MIPEIATKLGIDGATTTLATPGEVVVYSRNAGSWEPVRRISFSLDPGQGLVQLRQKMGELVAFLDECRIFITRAASGAIFFELEKAGCSVWEIDGRPEQILEDVWKEEEIQQETVPSGVSDIPIPVEISPGRYYLSIKEIQGKRPEVSSKMVLQKFIRAGKYQTLEVICDHVPPWISLESSCCGFTIESNQVGPGEVKVILTKNDPCAC